MDHKSTKTSLVLAFDPSGSLERLHISVPDCRSTDSTEDPESATVSSQATSEVSFHVTQISELFSWLSLRTEATRELRHLEGSDAHDPNAHPAPEATDYFQMSQKKYRQLLSAAKARGVRSYTNKVIEDETAQLNPPKLVLYYIGVDKSPRITWAVSLCSSILSSKLAMVAKIEHSKAVVNTLGGAYATLQRSGWAKHYARQQLAIARLTGDERLALRAYVYLKICKIIAIIFPKYADRKVYQDGDNHVTTRTDTNAKVEDARAISAARRSALDVELEELMEKAKKSENDEIVGLVKYAKHRVNNAPTNYRWLLQSEVSPEEYREMTEDLDNYGSLLRYMRYMVPAQEVWIVDSSSPIHEAIRSNMMNQVVSQQEQRSMAPYDMLEAKQARALRVSGGLREADTSWVSKNSREQLKMENGELWPSVLLEVGMDRGWEEMVSDINEWLQHSTNMTQAAIAIKIAPNSNKLVYRAHVQAWARNPNPPFEPIPLMEFPVQFGSEVEASQWAEKAIKIPWKFFYAIDTDVLRSEGFDDSWNCQHLELCKALHDINHTSLPSKAQGDFVLDLLQLHQAIEPLLDDM